MPQLRGNEPILGLNNFINSLHASKILHALDFIWLELIMH
jgi:hypothetical protein